MRRFRRKPSEQDAEGVFNLEQHFQFSEQRTSACTCSPFALHFHCQRAPGAIALLWQHGEKGKLRFPLSNTVMPLKPHLLIQNQMAPRTPKTQVRQNAARELLLSLPPTPALNNSFFFNGIKKGSGKDYNNTMCNMQSLIRYLTFLFTLSI